MRAIAYRFSQPAYATVLLPIIQEPTMPIATNPSQAPFVLVLNPGVPDAHGSIMIGHPSPEPAPLSPAPHAWSRARAATIPELARRNRGPAARLVEYAPALAQLGVAGLQVGASFVFGTTIRHLSGLQVTDPITETLDTLGPLLLAGGAVLTVTAVATVFLDETEAEQATVPLHVFVIDPPPAVQSRAAEAPAEAQRFGHDAHAIETVPTPQRTRSED